MNKYKSLIFRELRIAGKTYFSMFASAFFLMATFILGMFVTVRDLNDGESIEGLVLIISYGCAVISAAMFSDENGVFKADIATGWRRYSFALPVTALEKTVARYSVKLLMIIVGTVVLILSAAALSAVGGCSMSPAAIYCFFIVLDACMLINIVYETILLRANDKKAPKKLRIIASSVVIAIFAVLYFLPESSLEAVIDSIMTDLTNSDSPTIMNKYIDFITITDAAGFAAIGLTFVIFAVSFVIALKNNERRET